MTEIEGMIAEVRHRDRQRAIFGSPSHRYRSRRVPGSEVATLEDRLGTRLPDDYRAFLLEVGVGAGPYYGLWGPAQSWEEFDTGCADLVADGLPRPSASRPFPLSASPAAEGPRPAPYPSDGAIPIVHHGCTFWSVLLTAGAAVGTVWDVACFVGFEGQYVPARRPTGLLRSRTPLPDLPSPPTFTQWYRSWLERCLADVQRTRRSWLPWR